MLTQKKDFFLIKNELIMILFWQIMINCDVIKGFLLNINMDI